jgi:cell filamentation protein, protein adenylyltransferase
MTFQRVTGDYVLCSEAYDPYRAFVPRPLPPEPALVLDDEICDLMEKANRALGRLDGVTSLLPDTYLFTYFYVRKEAVLSSQIEGTQSSLQELLLFEIEEAPGAPLDDVLEVSNYVRALNYGLQSIRGEGRLPLSLRLFTEMHGILLSKGRGSEKTPGEFRRSIVWIGGPTPSSAVYVGPPAERLMECLDAFEKFLYDKPARTPVLIKAALAHVQFESIHPFQDGNGRLGRLLITLLLCSEEALKEPMLYLSLFFKSYRDEYYVRLQSVRESGDWEGWLRFFLRGVLETAQQAVTAAQDILRLFDVDKRRIATLGQRANSVLRVYDIIQSRPIISASLVRKMLETKGLPLSEPTVYTAIQLLEKLGILDEVTGKGRNRLYVYRAYMNILDEGTKPIEL